MVLIGEPHFAVPADEEFALARVDTEARERVDFDLLNSAIVCQ